MNPGIRYLEIGSKSPKFAPALWIIRRHVAGRRADRVRRNGTKGETRPSLLLGPRWRCKERTKDSARRTKDARGRERGKPKVVRTEAEEMDAAKVSSKESERERELCVYTIHIHVGIRVSVCVCVWLVRGCSSAWLWRTAAAAAAVAAEEARVLRY